MDWRRAVLPTRLGRGRLIPHSDERPCLPRPLEGRGRTTPPDESFSRIHCPPPPYMSPPRGSLRARILEPAVTIKNARTADHRPRFADGWVTRNHLRGAQANAVAIIGNGPPGLARGAQLNKVGTR